MCLAWSLPKHVWQPADCESRVIKSHLRSEAKAKTNMEQSLETFHTAAIVASPGDTRLLGLRHCGTPPLQPSDHRTPPTPTQAGLAVLGSWLPARPSASDASHGAQPVPLEGRDSSRSTENPGSLCIETRFENAHRVASKQPSTSVSHCHGFLLLTIC